MSEKLENFIKHNRKQFDELEVPEGIWSGIENTLNEHDRLRSSKQPKIFNLKWIKVAATITLVVTAGLFFLQHQKNAVADISRINPQLAKQQYYYTSVIQEKQDELKQIRKEDPALYNEFSAEINHIDENYRKLKNGLSTSPNREETVKAMIRNLQIQIQILNEQLQIIDRVNQIKKEYKNEDKSI
jgi:chromosome segregation ATPase